MVSLQVPVDRITTQAREIQFWRTVLTLIAAVLYGVGWIAYKTCAVTWLAAAWCVAAVKVGWSDAKGAGRGAA